jgi:L-lactate dehydrogenase complex protein LldG
MTTARQEILARVRRALADVPRDERPEDVDVPRAYLEHEAAATLERFVERVADYRAVVRVVAPADVARAVGDACRAGEVSRLAVPLDLPSQWLPDGIERVPDEHLSSAELDTIGATLTGCALAIAETGTIVLDGGPRQGRRALTLVPDVHVCVVEEAQVVDGVPAALRLLSDGLRSEPRPLTFVSGPSATSDIELSRVEGVHGPRHLYVIVVSAFDTSSNES